MAHLKTRQQYFNHLQRLEASIDTINPEEVTNNEINIRLETCEKYWNKLVDAHDAIVIATADVPEDQEVQEMAFVPMEKCYHNVKLKLSNFFVTTSAPLRRTTTKLPEMPLPTFDGKYEEWPTFADLFMSTFHRNTSLSSSEKLRYLISCTKGEALSVIKSYKITDANYKEAWQHLEQHYDNRREIIYSHIRKLLSQPHLKSESLTGLQQLMNTTTETVNSLKVLGRPTDQWDDILTVLLIEKFDPDTKAEWARTLRGTEPPTFQEIQEFVQHHIRTLHARGSNKTQQCSSRQEPYQAKRLKTHHTSTTNCKICKGTHFMYQCAKLLELSADKRSAAVKATGVCLNCFRDGHFTGNCTSPHTCKKCGKKHHTLLHFDGHNKNNRTQQQGESTGTNQPSSSTTMVTNTASFSSNSPTLLKTALVDVVDKHNVRHTLRVFIDDGGEGGLIKQSRMRQLGLDKQRVDVTITGVGGAMVSQSKWKTKVTLHSRYNNSSIDVELHAVPRCTGGINRLKPGSHMAWSHVAGLQLADPDYYKGGEVDILIGSNIAPYILLPGLIQKDINSPVAQETMFGWVLSGNVGGATPQPSFKINSFSCDISESLRRFWEIEEIHTTDPLTIEEQICERNFMETHFRQPDGRFVVRLPFNDKKLELGEGKEQARRRLIALERRFFRYPEYKEAYIKFMREYEALGHMEKVSNTNNTKTICYYLPHHFVLKEDSTTTKQRTVFDGSAKSSSGLSLNDTLLTGATVQPDLFTLILKFRYNKVAIKADIAKMYRQFMVHEDDRDFQRILWRESPTQPIAEYRLTTVTYGTKPCSIPCNEITKSTCRKRKA